MKKFDISGMSCAACSMRVEKAVSKLTGVDSCSVNLLTNSMIVEGTASESDIVSAVKKTGYGATPKIAQGKKITDTSSTLDDKESPLLLKRFLVSLGFLLPLMYIAMGAHLNLPQPKVFDGNPLFVAVLQMILSSVILVINQKFFINGFKGIIKLSPNMDTLVALGSGASFIYSTAIIFKMCLNTDDYKLCSDLLHKELYFESAAMILVLITVGKILEALSKSKTKNALRSLIKLKPTNAIILADGKEKEVDVSEIKVGDVFIVKAGGQIPVDGVIIEGEAAVDESSLTGESVPSEKEKDAKIYASTICKEGYIKAEATKIGEDTILSKIIKTVTEASATKAPISKIADTVSGFFVPVVVLIAFLSTVIWLICGAELGYSLSRGISVLVISCPCALGLATPVAIMGGSGVGAKRGILFKDASKLEECGKCDIILLDKTGTITEGRPEVTDIIPLSSDESELLRYAYTLEEKSEHPLSIPICELAREKNISTLQISSFKTLSGSGVEGEIDGERCFGASYKYTSSQLGEKGELHSHFERLANEGKTPLFFVKNDTPLGIIAVRDKIKIGSKETIFSLKEMGFYTVILTGDNEKTAAAVAAEVGVDKVISSVLPNGKEKIVKEMQKYGKVIMVGDGINDAPALACADIGIAIGNGSDIAIDTADIVLLKSRASDIQATIKLSRATLKIIKENLFWAFIYNLIGIPLAAGAFIAISGGALTLSPMLGALAMSLSSFSVVTNALRLNFFNEKRHYKKAKKSIIFEKEEKNMEIKLTVKGMMCPHCEARVKKALEELDSRIIAMPNHKKNEVVIAMQCDIPVETLKATIEAQGYTVK